MIGNLRSRVKIYQAIKTPDGRGGLVKTYTLWGSPYAEVRALPGRAQYKVVIRFRRGFPKEARMVWKDRQFQVAAFDDPDNRRERLHLICAEIVDAVP